MKIILFFGFLTLAAPQFTNKRNENSDATFLAYLKSDYQPCVGTLIHQQWVVTAAHCYLPYLQVKIGTPNQNIKGWLQDQEISYEFIFRHPNFTADSPEHDIILIKLAKSKNLHMLVDLPTRNNDLAGSICVISGWSQNWKYPFRDADIQINQVAHWLSPIQCKGVSSRNITVRSMNNMFCAGVYLHQQNFCQEVSAAAAICKGQLHGILSWTDGCVLKGDIGFYTKVSRYIDWILDIIKKN